MIEKPFLFLALASRLGVGSAHEDDFARLASMGPALRRAGFEFVCDAAEDRDDLVRKIRLHDPCLALCSSNAPEILEREALPYIGSPSATLELTRSKSRLKRLWRNRGVDSPDFFCVRRTRTGSIAGLDQLKTAGDYPYIVKPDGSCENRDIHAHSIAFDLDGLLSSVEAALEQFDDLIVERFLGGLDSREYTVAMIGSGGAAIMMPAEIGLKEYRPIRAVTVEDRERNLALALPIVDVAASERIGAFARRVFESSGVRDYARCDLIEHQGRLFALEVNGQPRLPDPWFEACSSGVGLDAEQYLASIALAAIHRLSAAGIWRRDLPPGLRAMLPPALFERLTR